MTKAGISNRLAKHMILGIVLGILAGVFFGELTQKLAWVGHAYIMLVEAAVFPYLISSLLHGIGSLQPRIAKLLLKRSWLIYLVLLLTGMLTIMGISWIIPHSDSLSVITSLSATPQHQQVSLNKILLPDNIFSSLANGYVPAVVIFAILSGIAMQKVGNKNILLQIFDSVTNVCIEFWKLLLKLAPIAVFCLMANIAGTINSQQLISFGIYFITLILMGIILIFWLFPIFITSLTTLSYRDVLKTLRSPLILTTTTTLTILSIPLLQSVIKSLLLKANVSDEKSKEIIETITLINYPFIQVGNLFVYTFILFAAFYYHHAISFQNHLILPGLSFLSSIGTPNSTINGVGFLTQWMHLSNDSVTLYASILPMIQFVMIPVSLMGYAAMTILTAFNYYGLLKLQFKKLCLHIIVIIIVAAASSWLVHYYLPLQNVQNFEKLQTYSINKKYTHGVAATLIPMSDIDNIPSRPGSRDSLFSIESSKILRVGYNPTAIPFSFFNNHQQLVGYDIAYAYILAKSLGVNLEFVPFHWNNLVQDLDDNKFDIAMSGAYVTPERLEKLGVSSPYYSSPAALIVPKDQEKDYDSIEKINKKFPKLRVAVDLPLANFAEQVFPQAHIIIESSIKKIGESLVEGKANIGITSRIQGQMWVAHSEKYTMVIPKKINEPILLGFMVNKHSPLLLNYVNYLLLLKQKDGFQRAVYDHWLLAKPLFQQQRWSVLHNILGVGADS